MEWKGFLKVCMLGATLLFLAGCDKHNVERSAAKCLLAANQLFARQEMEFNINVLKRGPGINPWSNRIGEETRTCMQAEGFREVGGCFLAGWKMSSCYRLPTIFEALGVTK